MIELTHPDKIYWPKDKIKKIDLINYYKKVARALLRYTKDRPLAMKRFPNGIRGGSFFQKDVPNAPSFVKTASISHQTRKVRYILIQNVKTLQYVANLGSIELHLFHSTVKSLDKPDFLLLDLDPTSISFDAVIETAGVIHRLLSSCKIPHFVKTSGGTGLHIMVPLKGKYTYEESKAYAKKIAKATHEMLPKITSLERSPAKRRKKSLYRLLTKRQSAALHCTLFCKSNAQCNCFNTPFLERGKKGANPRKIYH